MLFSLEQRSFRRLSFCLHRFLKKEKTEADNSKNSSRRINIIIEARAHFDKTSPRKCMHLIVLIGDLRVVPCMQDAVIHVVHVSCVLH
mmetsp:Transcript_13346/g.18888  ORF Transcript_13346/g.18888 Transcript_13346/m.18888 type:complete len:88 (-) Transcript_13346:270-533(-)